MSQIKLEKKFGQSPVFVASTLLENGGVPQNASPASLLKEAIHVISCGYEDKTDWGKEVIIMKINSLKSYVCILTAFMLLIHCFFMPTGWMDLWFCYRGYIDRLQNALPWMAVYLLYSSKAGIQRVCSNQSLRSSPPSFALGSWIG